MRALIISRPTFPVAQAEFPGIMQAVAGWRECYKPMMEKSEFFISGAGGCGIVNVPDDQTLARMLMEFPWGRYSDTEVHPILDGDTALTMWQDMLRQMAAGQG
jgi:hypothetical protein